LRLFFGGSHDFVGNKARDCAFGGPVEGMPMTHSQPDSGEGCVVPAPEVITALKDLYIVSSALAQRGANAQEIRDDQWRAMAQRAQEAKTALDQHADRIESHAIGLLRQMTQICQSLVEGHATRQEIPFAVWREVGRLGRDAYECVNLSAPAQRGPDA
jgi:hypothetical protein